MKLHVLKIFAAVILLSGCVTYQTPLEDLATEALSKPSGIPSHGYLAFSGDINFDPQLIVKPMILLELERIEDKEIFNLKIEKSVWNAGVSNDGMSPIVFTLPEGSYRLKSSSIFFPEFTDSIRHMQWQSYEIPLKYEERLAEFKLERQTFRHLGVIHLKVSRSPSDSIHEMINYKSDFGLVKPNIETWKNFQSMAQKGSFLEKQRDGKTNWHNLDW